MIQLDTNDAAGNQGGEEREQQREESSSDEGSSRGDARSENPELLQTRRSVESRGRVGGVQSYHGGVHSVANETLLDSRPSSSSSSVRANNPDSTLNRLSRSQFLDPHTRPIASASATRDVDASQALRDAYQGFYREPMLPRLFETPTRDFTGSLCFPGSSRRLPGILPGAYASQALRDAY